MVMMIKREEIERRVERTDKRTEKSEEKRGEKEKEGRTCSPPLLNNGQDPMDDKRGCAFFFSKTGSIAFFSFLFVAMHNAHTKKKKKSNMNGWSRIAGIPGRRAKDDKVFFFFHISLRQYPGQCSQHTPLFSLFLSIFFFFYFFRAVGLSSSSSSFFSRQKTTRKRGKKPANQAPCPIQHQRKKTFDALYAGFCSDGSQMPGSFVISQTTNSSNNHKQLLSNY